MTDLVVSCVEICLGSSSCPSFLPSPTVHDRYRLGNPVVILVELGDLPMFSSSAPDDGPFLEGCGLLDGATYGSSEALGSSAVGHNFPWSWSSPQGLEFHVSHHLSLFMSKFLNLSFKLLALKVCRFVHVGCLLVQSITLFHGRIHLTFAVCNSEFVC